MSTIGYYICVPFAWLVRLFYNLTGSYGKTEQLEDASQQLLDADAALRQEHK